MFRCYDCREEAVIRCANFDYKDFGYEGEGIVQTYKCKNCGAEIEYRIPIRKINGEGTSDEQTSGKEKAKEGRTDACRCH